MAPPPLARVLRRSLAVGLVAAGVALLPTSPAAQADPTVPANASQAEQELAQLGSQAAALNEQVLAAQDDLTAKRGAERAAQDQVAAAGTALGQARATQSQFQGTVDTLAAASYEGARVNQLSALMLSKSPQELLDQMSALDVLANDTNARVSAYSAATADATRAEAQAATAAQAASAAATAAQQTQDTLTAKQTDLTQQTATVKARFDALTAPQKASYAGTTVPAGYAAPAGSPAAASTASSGPAYTSPPGSGVGYAALQAALSKVGSPYVYGAAGPDSFDCSGLVQWAYAQAGVSLPRTSGAQAGVGSAVSPSDLQPGDILVFYGGGHVGLYAGNGMVVHAPDYGQPVKVAPMSYMPLDGARRV